MTKLYSSFQAPYIHSSCDCCTHKLHKENPYYDVTLKCTTGESRNISLPRIAECHCLPCLGMFILVGNWLTLNGR